MTEILCDCYVTKVLKSTILAKKRIFYVTKYG